MEKDVAQKMSRAEYEAYLKSKGRRRKQRRVSKHAFVGPLILVLFLVVCFVLCLAFFFRVDEISVRESELADSESVVLASGIQKGDNLLFLETDAARQNIFALNPEIDDCVIEKKFPSTIEIRLIRGEAAIMLEGEGCYYAVSTRDRIMWVGAEKIEGLAVIRGMEESDLKVGSFLREENAPQYMLAKKTANALTVAEMPDFEIIDVSDIYNINVLYDGRVRLVLGNEAKLETKVGSVAKTYRKDFKESEFGVIDGSVELYKTSVRKGEEHIRFFDRETPDLTPDDSEDASLDDPTEESEGTENSDPSDEDSTTDAEAEEESPEEEIDTGENQG